MAFWRVQLSVTFSSELVRDGAYDLVVSRQGSDTVRLLRFEKSGTTGLLLDLDAAIDDARARRWVNALRTHLQAVGASGRMTIHRCTHDEPEPVNCSHPSGGYEVSF